jgi:protein disulfide-isomerase-like protein
MGTWSRGRCPRDSGVKPGDYGSAQDADSSAGGLHGVLRHARAKACVASLSQARVSEVSSSIRRGHTQVGRVKVALVLLFSVLLLGGDCAQNLQPLEATVENFDTLTQTPSLVKFFAPWCAHCSMMAPAYNSLARTVHGEWDGAHVVEVNCDRHPEIGNRFQITGYPTLALVHKGKYVGYHGPKSMQSMLDFLKETVGRFHRKPNTKPAQTRCLNVARSDNGAHAESDGQKGGFGPFKAVDGKIRGNYGEHGEMALHSGWSWGTNLQQAMFLVAFNRVYSINRIKVFSGVGFVDRKITAFRLLYCNVKGGAYFSGYDTQSCWKPIPNVTAVNNYNREGETLFRVSKEKKNIIEAVRGVQLIELAMPPIRASGVSIQVLRVEG